MKLPRPTTSLAWLVRRALIMTSGAMGALSADAVKVQDYHTAIAAGVVSALLFTLAELLMRRHTRRAAYDATHYERRVL